MKGLKRYRKSKILRSNLKSIKKHEKPTKIQNILRLQKTSYHPKEEIHNYMWEFHKADKDFKPSVLHGHSGRLKLDAMDGAVYQDDKCIGCATKKELKRLQSDKKFQKFALERIEWYRNEYPKIPIEIPTWLNCNNQKMVKANKYSAPRIFYIDIKIKKI